MTRTIRKGAKMRMQLLKIVVVLLVAGSGDTRPQNGVDLQATTTIERSDAEWRGIQVSSKSHDIVRDDSRYTGTSGSNRKSYIRYFRDSADSSREHNAVGSHASDFAQSATAAARSFSARRSKLDDIWTMPESRAIIAPPHFSRTDVLGKIARIATVRNSSEADLRGSSLHVSSSNSKTIQNEKIGWAGFSPDLRVVRTNYSGKMNNGNLERSKSGVTANENLESVVARTRYSYSTGNDFLATHASGSEKTDDDISVAVGNRRKSSSIRSDSFANKGIEGETSRWKSEQGVNRSFLQIGRTNVPSNSQQVDAATRSIHKNRNSIRKNTDPVVLSHENSKSVVLADSLRHFGGNGLNNSERSAHGTKTSLVPHSKSEIVGHSRFPHGNAVTHRSFVKLRHPYMNSSRRNDSDVVSNTKLKNGNDAGSTGIELKQPAKGHLTRTAAKKPGSNNHATSKPTKNGHSSSVQKSPSQEIDGGNKIKDEHGGTSVQYSAYLKNWPNEALQDMEDLYNYEKYTASLEDTSHESGLSDADGTPILSSNNYFDTDPILDSSVKKIIHWLKVPAIVPNGTQFLDYNDDKTTEPVFESIYENLEPNRPLNDYVDNYESAVLQDTPPNQDLDKTDSHANYPIQWSNPSSVVRPQYVGSSNSSATLVPSSWSDVASLRNKTVFNPLTHVTQNTVVHILNDGLKKPNVTVTQLKTPETDTAAADQAASSSGSSSGSSELAQRPNVHIMFTSQKDEDKGPPKQENNTFPSTHNANCPTIMINTYTRVNNTIQSKEGCTDLNIIVNSHVSNTNVFTPSGTPAIAGDQQTSLATQSYGGADESEKYAEAFTDLFHEDSLNSYVTASTGTYNPSPLETPRPGQHNYYDSQKDPSEIPAQWNDPVQSPGLSTVEVFQGTQISVSGSSVPLADAEATASPAGSSADGPAAGPGVSASGPPVAGSLDSENPAQDLPVYLVKPGPVKGQASSGLGTLQLPSLPSRPSIAVNPAALSSVASQASSSTSGSSGSSSNDDDDDDDDDDDELSPGSVLESMASVFTYFSFLNPVGYGFFSLAAAPFAAMAAGVLGVAAVVFPWAIPSVLDFGRSARKTISFAPNLEEFVRRAVHKYDRLNEWKSRRRKRRR